MTEEQIWELYKESELRVRTAHLTAAVAAILVWFSFLLFLDSEERQLRPRAEKFLAAANLVERDWRLWTDEATIKVPAVEAALHQLSKGGSEHFSESYIQELFGLPLKFDYSDVRVNEAIKAAGGRTLGEFLTNWVTRAQDLLEQSPLLASDAMRLQRAAGLMNLSTNWFQVIYRESPEWKMDIAIPKEMEIINQNLPQPRIVGETFLFAPPGEFSRRMQEMQGLYQQWLLKRIEGQAIKSKRVGMLQNLDSARDICQEIVNAQPQLSLPVLGENVTGTWAFRVAPLLFLFLGRYLLVMIRTARFFERQVKSSPASTAGSEASAKVLKRKGRLFPHAANVLRAIPAGVRDPLNRLNVILLVVFLSLPASAVIPITAVQVLLHGASWWILVIVPFTIVILDTGHLIGLYLDDNKG